MNYQINVDAFEIPVLLLGWQMILPFDGKICHGIYIYMQVKPLVLMKAEPASIVVVLVQGK